MATENDKVILVCECNSTEHQIVIYYSDDEGEPTSYLHIHLNKKPFVWRLYYGIRYIFGRQCNYGAFDEFIFNTDDVEKLQELVDYLKKEK
jgi:hypothetical protein